MAQLAIKGHATRGREVIELLEMLGGNNNFGHLGNSHEHVIYYIDDKNNNFIYCSLITKSCVYKIFTLEEFLEKYPFKNGDKVCFSDEPNHYLTIKKIWWNEDCSDLECTFNEDAIDVSVKDLQPYKKDTIKKKKVEIVEILEDKLEDRCTDEVKIEYDSSKFKMVKKNNEYYLVRKQRDYPTTYAKCCAIMGGLAPERHLQYDNPIKYKFEEDLIDSLENLRKLIICRNAYWKIAGKEMRLGEPWKPNWKEGKTSKYTIQTQEGYTWAYYTCKEHKILAFPTKEMRDAFYENFRDLIELTRDFL